jgi:hypothetical protein
VECPQCRQWLTCPCDSCLCEPRYAGTARWIRLDDNRIRCPVCGFTENSDYWCAADAMAALATLPEEGNVQP